jgi:hypothetical protein
VLEELRKQLEEDYRVAKRAQASLELAHRQTPTQAGFADLRENGGYLRGLSKALTRIDAAMKKSDPLPLAPK